jgi:glycosyltransferase involved in cell wall biosynthesis
VRGFSYNGDALAIEVANAISHKYRVAVVAAQRAKALVKAIHRRDTVTIVRDPSDAALAELFASSRLVVHPSLCNGGGFVPVEALSFGCAVVASRTGWLLAAESQEPLIIVDRHDPEIYLAEALRILERDIARPLAAASR